jgi:hypothetical protein
MGRCSHWKRFRPNLQKPGRPTAWDVRTPYFTGVVGNLTPELRKRLLDVVKKFLRWLETKDFIDPVENPVSGLAVEDILPSLDGNRLGL